MRASPNKFVTLGFSIAALASSTIPILCIALAIMGIAHRLSTVVNADRIMVVSGGQIVESGTHAELLDKQGLYSALLTEQRLEIVG
jgi:ABC-type multidrug transport system fused ATPase/permease subunit